MFSIGYQSFDFTTHLYEGKVLLIKPMHVEKNFCRHVADLTLTICKNHSL